ncbi:uncharacterized protein LOC116169668 [Photinus pyralis]|uniref:uncharacterized protein LOC116169668 n=1 Tax=Photinus pyralis TaxID=7054 RepID=UPI0012671EFE|nr:uncharacterized protein LOC116169668 [Photinus pyralis]XP_031341677.1 uncharacterized protein LOC116169668 [Photinus pyralis]
MALSKFCEYFDLKEGFKAFAIILLMLRLLSFIAVPGIFFSILVSRELYSVCVGFVTVYCIWNLGSTITLIFALRGLYRNDAGQLFPNMVVMPMEIILTTVFGIVLPLLAGEPLFALYLLVLFIHIYHFICVYSLYKKFKREETVTPANAQNLINPI